MGAYASVVNSICLSFCLLLLDITVPALLDPRWSLFTYTYPTPPGILFDALDPQWPSYLLAAPDPLPLGVCFDLPCYEPVGVLREPAESVPIWGVGLLLLILILWALSFVRVPGRFACDGHCRSCCVAWIDPEACCHV